MAFIDLLFTITSRPPVLIDYVKLYSRNLSDSSKKIEAGLVGDMIRHITWGESQFKGLPPPDFDNFWTKGLKVYPPTTTNLARMTHEKQRRINILKDAKQTPLNKEMLSFYEAPPFEELHTHLLGMGDTTEKMKRKKGNKKTPKVGKSSDLDENKVDEEFFFPTASFSSTIFISFIFL